MILKHNSDYFPKEHPSFSLIMPDAQSKFCYCLSSWPI